MIIDWAGEEGAPQAEVFDANDLPLDMDILACDTSTGWVRSFTREFYVAEPLRIEWKDPAAGEIFVAMKIGNALRIEEREQQPGEGEG